MTSGVHQIDGRIASKSAVKIRAALKQSIDARQVITDYAMTHPTVSEFISQDRARARAWAMHNVTLDHEALESALKRHYATMYVVGVASTYDDFGKILRSKKAEKKPPHNWDAMAWAKDVLTHAIDWQTWEPGNKVGEALLRQPGGLEKLLNGVKIKSAEMKGTSYDLLGSKLADGLAIGASPMKLSAMIQDSIANPERSLMIALTEGSRAANYAAKDSFESLGVERIQWSAGEPDDDVCDIDGEVTEIDGIFSNGLSIDDMPAHPNCRCVIVAAHYELDADFVPIEVDQEIE